MMFSTKSHLLPPFYFYFMLFNEKHYFVLTLLTCSDPLQAVIGEVLNQPECDLLTVAEFTDLVGFCPRPFVLWSTYRHNIYMLFSNIPTSIWGAVLFASAALLRAIYSLPSEGKPHGADVVWGQRVLRTGVSRCCFSLSQKGGSVTLEEALSGAWHRCVFPQSPNAPLEWSSMLPFLFSKLSWYALWGQAVVVNLRALVGGGTPQRCRYPSYNSVWSSTHLVACLHCSIYPRGFVKDGRDRCTSRMHWWVNCCTTVVCLREPPPRWLGGAVQNSGVCRPC